MWTTLVVIAAIVGVFAVWKIPQLQVRSSTLDDKDRIDLEIKARGIVTQTVIGSFFLFTVYGTFRTVELSRRAIEVSERVQLTNRFTTAIQMLSPDSREPESSTKRLGGVYALEQIANESPSDYWPVMEVLCAYVRENAPNNAGAPASTAKRRADIDAAIRVIVRRARHLGSGETHRLNLSGTDLRGVNLSFAHLNGAYLDRAQLSSAMLALAHLNYATLRGSNLRGATLIGTDLTGAVLAGADLEGAIYDKTTKWPQGIEPSKLGAHLGDSKDLVVQME